MRTVLLASLLLASAQPPATPAKPVNDPVSAKGCLRGEVLEIRETGVGELAGIKEIRLKGPKALMKRLADYRNHYLNVVGVLTTEGGVADRLETRKKQKVGSRTTITVSGKAEQSHGTVAEPPRPELELESFEPLANRCPARS
jgi:hypothetical protein